MAKQHLNPKTLFPSTGHGFSQIVVASGGKTVFVSGQTAWDTNKQIVGRTLGDQAKQALRNVQLAVEAAGGSMDDVVSLRIYITEHARTNLSEISVALRETFPRDRPASTWIGVPFLANDDFLIEIEAIAVIP